ncbi:hypothetical protein VNI00_007217 [Paramarasmius palmivorus]|uniref:Gustatory receptor n=1 Tax=Paramarasmius palmivorus TaxID=297713 RepID=A0AAW0D2H3_9AGAR
MSTSSTIPAGLAELLTVTRIVVYPLTTLSLMYFVYGFYLLLFGTCMYMFHRKTKTDDQLPNSKLYLTLTVILFLLATTFVGDYTGLLVNQTIIHFTAVRTGDYGPLIEYMEDNERKTIFYAIEIIVPVLINITADCMLVHRCYTIWSSRKRVGFPLIFLSTGTNLLGLVGSVMSIVGLSDSADDADYALYLKGTTLYNAYAIASTAVNSILTILTAGRIWWIHRQARQTYGRNVFISDRLLQSIIRIILESGFLYPAVTIATLVIASTIPDQTPVDLSPLSELAAGLAPTLILEEMLTDMRFTSHPAETVTASRSQGQTHSFLNLELGTREVEQGSSGSREKNTV